MRKLLNGLLCVVSLLAPCLCALTARADWPQFRGPGGNGVAGEGEPPVEFSAAKNVRWKTPLPPGHSSPIVVKGRVFVTALEGGKLVTIGLDARDGKVIWKSAAPAKAIEKVHEFNSPAAATPASDGERVYVYFGSVGLIAYEMDGKEAWRVALPTPETDSWGSGSSPVVVGELVIQTCDSNAKDASFVIAVDRKSGKQVWKTGRPGFKASWSTPCVWKHDGIEELIVLGSGRVVSYEPATGKERWSVGGFSDYGIAMAAANEEMLFVCSGGPAGGEGQMNVGTWEEISGKFDRNRDGTLGQREIPADAGVLLRKELPKELTGNFVPYSRIFEFSDENKDKSVTQGEWEKMLGWVRSNGPLLAAIRAGGKGDATLTHVAWKVERGLPEMPSPLVYQGRLYLVRDGGLLTCIDPATGKEVYRGRVESPGQYAASPVAADGHVYVTSVAGVVSVVKAGDRLQVVARNELGEWAAATPAIDGDVLYVRTEGHLWAFGGD